jgi:hypothetical protein
MKDRELEELLNKLNDITDKKHQARDKIWKFLYRFRRIMVYNMYTHTYKLGDRKGTTILIIDEGGRSNDVSILSDPTTIINSLKDKLETQIGYEHEKLDGLLKFVTTWELK